MEAVEIVWPSFTLPECSALFWAENAADFKAEVSPTMAKVTFVGAARSLKVKSLGGFPPPDRTIRHSGPHPASHLQTEKSSCAPSCHLDCLLGRPKTCSTSLVLNSPGVRGSPPTSRFSLKGAPDQVDSEVVSTRALLPFLC